MKVGDISGEIQMRKVIVSTIVAVAFSFFFGSNAQAAMWKQHCIQKGNSQRVCKCIEKKMKRTMRGACLKYKKLRPLAKATCRRMFSGNLKVCKSRRKVARLGRRSGRALRKARRANRLLRRQLKKAQRAARKARTQATRKASSRYQRRLQRMQRAERRRYNKQLRSRILGIRSARGRHINRRIRAAQRAERRAYARRLQRMRQRLARSHSRALRRIRGRYRRSLRSFRRRTRRFRRRYRRRRVRRRVRVSSTLTARGIRRLVVRQHIVSRCNARLRNISEVRECLRRYEYILQRYIDEAYDDDGATISDLRLKLGEYKQLYLRLTSAKRWAEFGVLVAKNSKNEIVACGLRKYKVGAHRGYRRLNEDKQNALHQCIRAIYDRMRRSCERTLRWIKRKALAQKLLNHDEAETMKCEVAVVVKGYADWRSLKYNMTLAGNRRGDLIQAVYAALGRSVAIDSSSQHEIGEFQYERASKVMMTARIKNAAYLAMIMATRRKKAQKLPRRQRVIVYRTSKKVEKRLRALEKGMPKDFNKWKKEVTTDLRRIEKYLKNLKFPVRFAMGVGWRGWLVLDDASQQTLELNDRANMLGMVIEIELRFYFNWNSLGFAGIFGQINPLPTSNRFGDGIDVGVGTFVGVDTPNRWFSFKFLFMYRWSRVNVRQTRVLGQDFLNFGLGIAVNLPAGFSFEGQAAYQLGMWRSTTSHGAVFNFMLKWGWP